MYRLAFRSSHQRSLPPRSREAWCAALNVLLRDVPPVPVPLAYRSSVYVPSMTTRRIARPSGSTRPRATRQSTCRRCTARRIARPHGSSASPRATHALLILGAGAVDVPHTDECVSIDDCWMIWNRVGSAAPTNQAPRSTDVSVG